MHKRERFERSDVPRDAKSGMILAGSALAFLLVGLLIGLGYARSMVTRDSSLGNRTLGASIGAQGDVEAVDGYQISDDAFTNVLLFTVDDLKAPTPTLTGAQLLSLNTTTHTGTIVNVPINTRLTTDAGKTPLSAQFAGSGASSCIVPFQTVSGVKITHAIISVSEVWDQVAHLHGAGVQYLVSSESDLFGSMTTDMNNSELMDVAELVQSIGVDNLTRIDAPVSEATLDDGTAVSVIDATKLDVALGTIVEKSK